MTWHVRGKLKGLLCFHVDDIMISGPKNDPEFKRMMDKVKSLLRMGENGNVTNSINVAAEYVKQTDKSVTVAQESHARKIDLITMSAHRRKHMTETLSNEEHTTMMAKRGELNWLETQSMIQLLASLSLIDTSKTATGQSLKDLNRLVRQAHCEASDKLHYPLIFEPSVCFFCRCCVGKQERFRFSVWISLYWNREITVGRKRRSLLSNFLALSPMSQSCTLIRFS